MSIIVLKKKSNIKSSTLSKGNNGFSLNGYRRLNSSSRVGGNLNARRRVYTPMKGSSFRANGGSCCKNYGSKAINANTPYTLSNNVKVSTKNNKGMISDKLRCCIYGSFPNNVVKNLEAIDYERYLQNKTGEAGSCVNPQVDAGVKTYENCPSKVPQHYVKDFKTQDQSLYLKTHYLNNNCVLNNTYVRNPNVYLDSSGNITSGVKVFITGGIYTFYFEKDKIKSIHLNNIPNTLESFTLKMPAAYNFIVTGVDGMNTYTIFNKGPYKGITC